MSLLGQLPRKSSRTPLFDLRKLNASLPVPSVPKVLLKVPVLGAKDDFIVVNPMFDTYNCLLLASFL